LPLPPGYQRGAATDVDDDGTIVGAVNASKGVTAGYVWLPDGTGKLIDPPTVDGTKATGFNPNSIHHGVIVGIASVPVSNGTRMRPMLYDLASGRFTALPSVYGPASPGGWIAGSGTDGTGGLLLARADKQVRLPGLREPADKTPPVLGDLVNDISDDGRLIAGQAGYDDDPMHFAAVTWRCG
jgi:hypothetical protein